MGGPVGRFVGAPACARRASCCDIVEVDAAQASCPGFVGPALDVLAITTAQEGLDEVTDQAGAIFVAEVGVTGLPPLRWAGSTSAPSWRRDDREEGRMRLVRVGDAGSETPGALVDDDTFVDLSDVVGDFDEAFFGSGPARHPGARSWPSGSPSGRTEPLAGRRLGRPIARPHQILCIGLNYRDHAAETGQAVPDEPILFTKAPNTLIGPDDDVQIPRGSRKTDWEVELGIVIGSRASYLADETEAAAAIAGYVLVNDVSEREWQIERNGQWSKGKSAPTFNPAGPYLVTPDEVGDVLALDMWLDIDGVRRQTGSTSTMIFSPTFIVHYLSQFLTLEPGDLINTGTPPGVGMGQSPQVFLKGGETMTLGIDRLGTQTQRVLGAPAAPA